MRIQRLEVEGFRSLKKVSWEPGALNVVIGPNGSGKSNVLKLLELLQHSSRQRLDKYIQSLGGVRHITWDSIDTSIEITLETTHSKPIITSQPNNSLHLCVDTFSQHNAILITREVIKNIFGTPPTDELVLYRDDSEVRIIADGNENTYRTDEIVKDDELVLSLASSPFKIGNIIFLLSKFISTASIYRNIDTSDSSIVRYPVVTAYEKSVLPDGSNLIQVLHTLYTSDRNFESDIDSAMNAAFGNDYEKLVFPPAADQRVQLRIRWKSLKREQSALDISDGTLRFLYLLAILANPDPSPLIAIDEPETGLHPSMFPIIAEFAQDCSRKSQIIFTTHSPQFLDAFGDTPPTTTVAQWQNGETILKVLDGERLAKWLKHYSMGSMFMSGELEAFD